MPFPKYCKHEGIKYKLNLAKNLNSKKYPAIKKDLYIRGLFKEFVLNFYSTFHDEVYNCVS